jgi:hypothetical protein
VPDQFLTRFGSAQRKSALPVTQPTPPRLLLELIARFAKGPLQPIKDRLKQRLLQQYDIWQADFRRLPEWILDGAERIRPWMILVMSRTSGLILADKLALEEPSPAALWDILVRAPGSWNCSKAACGLSQVSSTATRRTSRPGKN